MGVRVLVSGLRLGLRWFGRRVGWWLINTSSYVMPDAPPRSHLSWWWLLHGRKFCTFRLCLKETKKEHGITTQLGTWNIIFLCSGNLSSGINGIFIIIIISWHCRSGKWWMGLWVDCENGAVVGFSFIMKLMRLENLKLRMGKKMFLNSNLLSGHVLNIKVVYRDYVW